LFRRLYLEDYRAFERADIKLSKINLFFGPNNAGKSAILSAINLLAQTLKSADSSVPLLLTGAFEDLGSYRDIVYRNDPEKHINITLDFDVPRLEPEKSPAAKGRGRRTTPFVMNYYTGRLDLGFYYRPRRRKIDLNKITVALPVDHVLLQTKVSERSEKQVFAYVNPEFQLSTMRRLNRALTLDHFLPSLALSPLLRMPQNYLQRAFGLFRQLGDFTSAASELLESIEFVGPFRSRAERVYTFSGESPTSVGVHGDKAVQVLMSDFLQRKKNKRDIALKVTEWLQQAEIAKKIQPVTLSPRHFELRLTHFRSGEDENIADVGYGCSQILPILVAGFSRPPGSTLVIEQPELHLHPKAQAELGTFLCSLKERNLQLLVETHSEHLLLRLQSHIASGHLSPDDVVVYYVDTDKKDRKKYAKMLPIGRDGIFLEEWPEGFFPERLRESKRLAGLLVK